MPLSTNQEKQALIDLMGKTTLEVTPGGAAKVGDFSQILRAGCTVYVTFLARFRLSATPWLLCVD
jgi:hypothetical protein